MGRLADLCATIATEVEEGPSGLELPSDSWSRLRRDDWLDGDIEDALGIVRDSLLQDELFDAADSLSARMVDLLSDFAERHAFDRIAVHGASIPIDVIAQLVRRVSRLEEILDAFRDDSSVDRHRFDELRRRLADVGIENAMNSEVAHDECE
jgi:hypothetical protein